MTARCWAVIPARRASTRLPDKVLADLGGLPMIVRTWRAACAAGFDAVTVATDDPTVASVAEAAGADVFLTGPAVSGTHRAAAFLSAVDPGGTVAVVVVQADVPLIPPADLGRVATALREGAAVATLSAPLPPEAQADPARVKVVTDAEGRAVTFTRAPTPGARLHVGIYGFGPGWLARCCAAPRTHRTLREDLEQLAWLDAGIPVRVDPVPRATPSIDTPADLALVRAILSRSATGGLPSA